jgi:hypothetical protein
MAGRLTRSFVLHRIPRPNSRCAHPGVTAALLLTQTNRQPTRYECEKAPDSVKSWGLFPYFAPPPGEAHISDAFETEMVACPPAPVADFDGP